MIFEGIKKETNIIIEYKENKCDNCIQKKIQCKECEKYNCGLSMVMYLNFMG